MVDNLCTRNVKITLLENQVLYSIHNSHSGNEAIKILHSIFTCSSYTIYTTKFLATYKNNPLYSSTYMSSSLYIEY